MVKNKEGFREILEKNEEMLREMHPVIMQKLFYPCLNCKKIYSFFGQIVESFSNPIDLEDNDANFLKIDGSCDLK